MPCDKNPSYLGDGVYASHDGFQIWLASNHHKNKVIAIEPEVMQNLVNYAHRLGMRLTIPRPLRGEADD